MGIFSFSPLGVGKGVRKDERKLKRPLMLLYNMFANFTKFIKASMLFTLTCLPIFTIGPSLCGLTYVSYNITEDKPVFMLSDYFEYFRKNFFKGLIAFIISIIPAFSLFVIFINIRTVPHFSNFILPLLLVNLIVFMMSFYMYPLIIFYDLSILAIIKNSFLFALMKLPLNLFITFIILGLLYLSFGFYTAIGMTITPLFLFAFLNYFTTFLVWPTIKKTMEG